MADANPEIQQLSELVIECMVDGIPLSVIKGYTDDEIEAAYNVAYNLYQQQKYKDAEKLFTFLMMHDHTDSRFSIGLGGCYQLTGDYEKAINMYSCAALIDATNPIPAFHACECYIALKDWEGAKKSIDAIKIVCEATADETNHSELLTKIAALSETINARANLS